MNKVIKTLILLFSVGIFNTAVPATMSSTIKYFVNLPQNSKWGVYAPQGTSLPRYAQRTPGTVPNLCVVPVSGGINNSATQSGSLSYLKIVPCGDTGCTSNGAPTNCSTTGNSCTNSSGQSTTSVKALLYAQNISQFPFISSQSLTSLFTQQFGTIDMSQYWQADSSGNFQVIYAVDLATQGNIPEITGEF